MILYKYIVLIQQILLWIFPVNADFEGKLLTVNTGCTISGVSLANGYSANIYSYSWDDLTDYSNTEFFNGKYSSKILTSASLVTNPNFINNNGYSTSTTSELWGIDVPITNFVAQLTGYFYGMYLINSIFFSFFFNFQYTNITLYFYS